MAEEEPVQLQDTLNAHWKNNKNSFGFRMLQKMGWQEDQGLGKDGTGIVSHVKMKKRDTNMGLGMEGVVDDTVGSKAWNSTVHSFNSVLEVLKSSYAKPVESPEAKRSKKSKKEKKEKKRKRTEDDGVAISEATEAPKKVKKPRAIVSVGIKYKKFRDAKDLSLKSHVEKTAIFGHHGNHDHNLRSQDRA